MSNKTVIFYSIIVIFVCLLLLSVSLSRHKMDDYNLKLNKCQLVLPIEDIKDKT